MRTSKSLHIELVVVLVRCDIASIGLVPSCIPSRHDYPHQPHMPQSLSLSFTSTMYPVLFFNAHIFMIHRLDSSRLLRCALRLHLLGSG